MFDDLPDLALSVRQPWPWAIFNAGKDIENRDWSTSRRGAVCIHASGGMTLREYHECMRNMADIGVVIALPGVDDLQRGGIVGVADIVDCVRRSDSPWFFGAFGFVLRNPRPLPFIPVRGALGFFKWKGKIQ